MRPRSPNGGRAQPDSRRAPRGRATGPAKDRPGGAVADGRDPPGRHPPAPVACRGRTRAGVRGVPGNGGAFRLERPSDGRARTSGRAAVGARTLRSRAEAPESASRRTRTQRGTAHGGRNDLHRRGGAHGCARHGDTVLGRLGIGRGRPGRLVVGRRRGRRLLVLRRRFVLRRRLVLRWRWWWRLRWRGWRRRLLSHRAGGRRPAGTWGPGVVPRPGGPLISRPTRGSWSPFTRPSGRTPVLFHAYGMEIWTSWVKALRTATIS